MTSQKKAARPKKNTVARVRARETVVVVCIHQTRCDDGAHHGIIVSY